MILLSLYGRLLGVCGRSGYSASFESVGPNWPPVTLNSMMHESHQVKVPRQVGGGQHKDLGTGLCQAIHLDEELCLGAAGGLMLPLCPSAAHQGVYLIQEDCGGGMVARQLKQHLQQGKLELEGVPVQIELKQLLCLTSTSFSLAFRLSLLLTDQHL